MARLRLLLGLLAVFAASAWAVSPRATTPVQAGDRAVSYGSASSDIGDLEDAPVTTVALQRRRAAQGAQATQPAPEGDASAAEKLSTDLTEDDYPSIAVDPEGTVWAAWQAYDGSRDEVRLRRYDGTAWRTFTRLPNVSGDVWRPQLVFDANHALWVVWAQQVNGNWDLYARAFDGQQWLPEARLTTAPLPDINHHVIRDGGGNLCVVWQGFRPGLRTQSDVFLKTYDHLSRRWSAELRVSSSPANDWDPAVAADGKGNVWVAWDTYAAGNYDVLLQAVALAPAPRLSGGPLPVAVGLRAEMRASVACDRANRVWVAYESSRPNWGKDQGYTVRQNPIGVPLGGPRELGLRVLADGKLMEPPSAVEAMPEGERGFFYTPRLLQDERGRMWLMVRHRTGRPNPGPNQPNRQRSFWREWLTRCDGDRWTPAVVMPQSLGRQSSTSSAAAGADGTIWVAWSTDNRQPADYHRPVRTEVYAMPVRDAAAGRDTVLRDPAPEPAPEPAEGKLGRHGAEPVDLHAIRTYRARVGNADCQIVRGDLHRHTELSWDGGGTGDGSVLDFYRYMMDAASMDFGAITDHNAGGDYRYWWWLTEKLADMYHHPGGYVPVFAYERSAVFPNGHRNIVHAYRGVPVVSFFTRPDLNTPRPGIGTGALLENDTKLLYEELRKTKGISIPHTSGTRMGTDWRDNNRALEPVVEIFQGARTNYEYAGAPKSADPQKDAPHIVNAGYQPEGFVWNAWKRGYRLGVITSSDHGSTHMSYAMVYTPAGSRQAIVDSIRSRHTYGATDNIILEFRMGDAFMGDEITAAKSPPPATIRVRGTNELARIDLIRNDKFIYNANPAGARAELVFRDTSAPKGTSYYYVRVQQEDGQIAWSSPIWVSVR